MKVAIFKRPDGSISYRTPCWPMLDGETELQYFDRTERRERQAGSVKPDWVRVAIVEQSALPQHYGFRNAMRFNGSVVCDLQAAKIIHRDKLRDLRTPLMHSLDCEWMMAVGTGNTTKAAQIEARRQLLRDAPAYPAIDAAASPLDLKAAIPDCLK